MALIRLEDDINCLHPNYFLEIVFHVVSVLFVVTIQKVIYCYGAPIYCRRINQTHNDRGLGDQPVAVY